MTKDSDLKQVVRRRMAETGEAYTAARAAVLASPSPGEQACDAARVEQERLVGRLFHEGRIARVPARRKVRAAVLLEVLTRFEPGRTYSEPEVNEVLRTVHEDVAYLRRELVNYHYLERGEGRYRTAARAPHREPHQLQEIPAWEACWLPGFLAAAGSGQ